MKSFPKESFPRFSFLTFGKNKEEPFSLPSAESRFYRFYNPDKMAESADSRELPQEQTHILTNSKKQGKKIKIKKQSIIH